MEIWDLYNLDREVVGEHIRGNAMPVDAYHLVVHIWIRNKHGQYLFTQRSINKKTCPLKWECVGGSVLKGESSLHAAIREVNEEVGIDLSAADGGLVMTQIRDMDGETRVNDINDIYLFEYDGDVNLELATTDEVADFKWITKDEIIELFQKREVVTGIKDLSYFINDKDMIFI